MLEAFTAEEQEIEYFYIQDITKLQNDVWLNMYTDRQNIPVREFNGNFVMSSGTQLTFFSTNRFLKMQKKLFYILLIMQTEYRVTVT